MTLISLNQSHGRKEVISLPYDTSGNTKPIKETTVTYEGGKMLPRYAAVKEISAWFGLSRSTQYRMIKRGEIEAVKVGRGTRILTDSVERYFASLPRLGEQSL